MLITIALLSLCVLYFNGVSRASSHAISIPPDEFWNGIDGKWSTFHIQVGTPGQALQVLPGTSASPMSATWVIDTQGCTIISSVLANPLPRLCDTSRGGLFNLNQSTTYSTQRLQNKGNGTIYSFNTVVEGYLGDLGNAYFGFDTISLGLPGSDLPTLTDQVIGSLVIPNFWIGFLGLSPWPTNFTSFLEPQTSMLSTLVERDLIPSTSWAYTAGAWYKSPPIFGSLTLGGYDSTRFKQNNATFTFGADLSRDLLVSLISISSDVLGQPPLLAQSIDIFIDSLISEIWLPTSVCKEFERQFQLEFDNVTQRYLLDEKTHDALIAADPSFTFNIGQPGAVNSKTEQTVDIVLPYAAFDLNVTNPIVNGSARYFPLRRATNEMQYILGRVFLQEAYVIANYERRQFSVSQAKFPSTAIPQDIVDIKAPDHTNSHSKTNSTDHNKHSLSSGGIAGITIGCCLVVLLAFLVLLYHKRVQRRKRAAASAASDGSGEMAGKDEPKITELEESNGIVAEMSEDAARHEMHVQKDASELPAVDDVAELEARDTEARS